MGFHISLWSFIGSIIYTLIQGKFIQFLSYIQQYPQVIPEILFLTIYSVLGQVFIFYCISCFSPRVLSVVTTTRKFFTVLLSIMIHNHEVDQVQWIGISLVALGVAWELFMGMSSRIPAEKKKGSYIKVPYEEEKKDEETNGYHNKEHKNDHKHNHHH
ncbi:unnamed protein product [Paramecium octaurelia]|uniref:Uncharacterized protein n=1 Tax=Paramecium octaurelia TaxID=43137 RepID=A0A8S1UWV2_PAROT|nr:unnamed protein product [Paramecium octaurelia]